MQDRFRFRFRILEKEDKVMYEVDALGYSSYDPFAEGKSRLIMIPSGIYNSFAYNKQCLYDSEKFSEPMQCTGLKDKNGKLIYEGDIVKRTKFKNGNISIGKVIYCEDEARYKILISDNDKYSYKDYTKIVNLYDVAYHLEIIGNIYENPELLY